MYTKEQFEVMYDEYLEQNEPEVFSEFKVEDSLVTLFEPIIEVHGFEEDMYAAEGIWSEKYEGEDEYTPDWDLTWFWKKGESPENYYYFEQDGIMVSAYNLSHATNVAYSGLSFDFAKNVNQQGDTNVCASKNENIIEKSLREAKDHEDFINRLTDGLYEEYERREARSRSCETCKKWYLNDQSGKQCSWNNNEVPMRDDFCSRWDKKE